MLLVYVGAHDAVEVYDRIADFGFDARDGEPVEVRDDVAMRLLEQRDNWAKAPSDKPAKDGK